MKNLLIYISLVLAATSYSCNRVCKPTFFDRIADTATHKSILGPDSIICFNNGTAGYYYYAFAELKRRQARKDKLDLNDLPTIGPGNNLPHNGKISLGKKGLYLQNEDNTTPFLVLPLMPKGYSDTIRYKISIDKDNYYPFKRTVSIDDVFYDGAYTDTIYKITFQLTAFDRKHTMFQHYDVIFIGKHIGIIGAASPFTNGAKETDTGELLLLYQIGNVYAKKYNYSLRSHNYL